jgi:hypothetical protein
LLLEEIEAVARRYAAEYIGVYSERQGEISDQNAIGVLFLKIVEVYKLLIIPENTLRSLFRNLGSDATRQEFRRIAMLVHPDKNCHPQAKIAFQKLLRHFKEIASDSE